MSLKNLSLRHSSHEELGSQALVSQELVYEDLTYEKQDYEVIFTEKARCLEQLEVHQAFQDLGQIVKDVKAELTSIEESLSYLQDATSWQANMDLHHLLKAA